VVQAGAGAAMLGRSGKGLCPGQRKYHDIEHAVADLHGMLDALR
jgi:hypothetical protein